MKKKMLATALVATMMLSITACGGKEDMEQSGTPTTEQQVQEQTQENEASDKEEKADVAEIKEEDLGPLLKQITSNGPSTSLDSEGGYVYLNFPANYSKGRESLYCHMTFDTEDSETVVLVSGLTDLDYDEEHTPTGTTEYSIENVLPVHSSMIIDSIDYNYGAKFKDFALEIKDGELVDVNGTEMCKHIGTLTYTEDGTAVEKNVVGYSASTSYNAYVYFIVCSLDAQKAEKDAYFIAQTVRETREFE